MGSRKSSRVNYMNYIYKIRKSQYCDSFIVAEYLNNVKTRVWDLKDFFSNSIFIQNKLEDNSFKKAKQFLKQNYPEFFI